MWIIPAVIFLVVGSFSTPSFVAQEKLAHQEKCRPAAVAMAAVDKSVQVSAPCG